MNTPQTITFPVDLSRAELAFLLTLLEAPPPIGVEQDELFPPDESERMVLFLEGKAGLEARGWLRRERPDQPYQIEPALLDIARNLGFPFVEIVCNLRRASAAMQGVSYSVGRDMVVELARADDRYVITPLESPAVAGLRLAAALGLPPEPRLDVEFVLPRPAFEAARKGLALAQPLPLPGPEAASLEQDLAAPALSAMVSLFGDRGREADELRVIGVLVGPGGDAWLVVPVGPDQIRLAALGAAGFQSALLALLADLQATRV